MVGKEKLVGVLRQSNGYTVKEAEAAYDGLMVAIKVALDAGEPVRIPGVGVITLNDIPAHTAKNPQTQLDVDVPDRYNYKLSSATKDR